jgi:hypothetical protein
VFSWCEGPFTFGENPHHPVNRRLCWLHIWFGRCRKEKNLLPLPEVEENEEFPRLIWSCFHLHYFIRKLKENDFQKHMFKKSIINKQATEKCRILKVHDAKRHYPCRVFTFSNCNIKLPISSQTKYFFMYWELHLCLLLSVGSKSYAYSINFYFYYVIRKYYLIFNTSNKLFFLLG